MRRVRLVALLLLAALASESHGIEMFTYFGDGSRIGLPSLEVPIEAYPGIPLRSDRLRAKRRAMRPGVPASRAAPGTPVGGGVTIRPMPTTTMPEPIAAPAPAPVPKAKTPAPKTSSNPRNAASQPAAN